MCWIVGIKPIGFGPVGTPVLDEVPALFDFNE